MQIAIQAMYLVHENRKFAGKGGGEITYELVKFLEEGDVFEGTSSIGLFDGVKPNTVGIFKIEIKPKIIDNKLFNKMKVVGFESL